MLLPRLLTPLPRAAAAAALPRAALPFRSASPVPLPRSCRLVTRATPENGGGKKVGPPPRARAV